VTAASFCWHERRRGGDNEISDLSEGDGQGGCSFASFEHNSDTVTEATVPLCTVVQQIEKGNGIDDSSGHTINDVQSAPLPNSYLHTPCPSRCNARVLKKPAMTKDMTGKEHGRAKQRNFIIFTDNGQA